MAERQKRTLARAEQVKRQQQQDLETRKELPTPLTELEKLRVKDKKEMFSIKNEAFETTNRAFISVKQIMNDLQVQPRGNIPKIAGIFCSL